MDESKALLILKLRQIGVSNPEILDCIESIDRSHFVSKSFLDRCLEDIALPIDCGQTVSQPSLVGFMTQQLEIPQRSKVLEIGTGSGYQTAILARFCRKVFSLERIEALSLRADNNLKKVGIDNYQLRWSDGTLGWPTPKKFDAIICTAAISQIPKKLKTQLEVHGKLICPVGDGKKQHLLLLEKKSKDEFHETILDSVLFVPMLEGKVSE